MRKILVAIVIFYSIIPMCYASNFYITSYLTHPLSSRVESDKSIIHSTDIGYGVSVGKPYKNNIMIEGSLDTPNSLTHNIKLAMLLQPTYTHNSLKFMPYVGGGIVLSSYDSYSIGYITKIGSKLSFAHFIIDIGIENTNTISLGNNNTLSCFSGYIATGLLF